MSKANKLMAVGLHAAAMRELSKGRMPYRKKRDDWHLAPKNLDDILWSDPKVRAAKFWQLSVSDLKNVRVGIVCRVDGVNWIDWNTKIRHVEKSGLMGSNIYLENWNPRCEVVTSHAIVADEDKNAYCMISLHNEPRVPAGGFLAVRLSIDISWR